MMNTEAVKVPRSKHRRKRSWPVTVVGILLLLQAVFLVSIFPVLLGYEFYQLPEITFDSLFPESGGIAPLRLEVESLRGLQINIYVADQVVHIPLKILTAMVFSFISVAVLLTSIAFLALWRHAWTLAVFLQGLILLASLIIYFYAHHPYIYLVMLFSIFLVFYLNYYEVRITFQVLPGSPTGNGER